MKQPYFTTYTINKVAKVMAQEITPYTERRKPVRISSKTALLVLDMQRYFLDENSHSFIPSAAAIIPRVRAIVEAFIVTDKPVLFTQHINTPENSGALGRWWQDIITADSELSKLTPELNTTGAKVIQKTQYDAFYNTNLHDHLQKLGVSQVVITGVMTHLCCETTARSAFVHGYDVLFTIDGTATYNREHHVATLTNLAHGFAIPVQIHEILEAFSYV